MLEFALLGLLKERPMHGYDLRKRLREEFGPLSNLSYGSLYPALARLEADGMISALDVTTSTPRRDPMPLTGSLGGERAATVARRATQVAALALSNRGTRGRKVYEITSRGEVLFDQLLDAEVASDDPPGFHAPAGVRPSPQPRGTECAFSNGVASRYSAGWTGQAARSVSPLDPSTGMSRRSPSTQRKS